MKRLNMWGNITNLLDECVNFRGEKKEGRAEKNPEKNAKWKWDLSLLLCDDEAVVRVVCDGYKYHAVVGLCGQVEDGRLVGKAQAVLLAAM